MRRTRRPSSCTRIACTGRSRSSAAKSSLARRQLAFASASRKWHSGLLTAGWRSTSMRIGCQPGGSRSSRNWARSRSCWLSTSWKRGLRELNDRTCRGVNAADNRRGWTAMQHAIGDFRGGGGLPARLMREIALQIVVSLFQAQMEAGQHPSGCPPLHQLVKDNSGGEERSEVLTQILARTSPAVLQTNAENAAALHHAAGSAV